MNWYYLMSDTEGYKPVDEDPLLNGMPAFMGERLARAIEVFINDRYTIIYT